MAWEDPSVNGSAPVVMTGITFCYIPMLEFQWTASNPMFEFNESFCVFFLCPRNALSHLQWIPGSLPNRTAVIPLPFLIVDLLKQLKNIFGLAGRSYRPHIDPSCTCDSICRNPFTKSSIYGHPKNYDNNFNGLISINKVRQFGVSQDSRGHSSKSMSELGGYSEFNRSRDFWRWINIGLDAGCKSSDVYNIHYEYAYPISLAVNFFVPLYPWCVLGSYRLIGCWIHQPEEIGGIYIGWIVSPCSIAFMFISFTSPITYIYISPSYCHC